MKQTYSTPIINVEELAKSDVLCASNEVDSELVDNYTLFDYMMESLFNWNF